MKKKLLYYILISLFPICLFLILLGTFIQKSDLTYIGVWALFGGFFLLAVLSVILIFMRARKKADEMDAQEQKGEEYSPAPSDHRYDALADAFAVSIRGFRHASAANKLLTIMFLIFGIGSVFVGLILLFFRRFIAAYVCFGVFGGTLFIGLIAAILSTCGVHIRKMRKRKAAGDVKTATVLSCDPYSSSYSYSEQSQGDPVTLYRVQLKADGIQYNTLDTHNYEAGTSVFVHITNGDAYILRVKSDKEEA